MYDFEGLAQQIHDQKRFIYVEPESYLMLQEAKTTSEINQSLNPKHVYVSKEQYVARIKRDKEREKKRKDLIWSNQEALINDKKRREKDEERMLMDQLFQKKN